MRGMLAPFPSRAASSKLTDMKTTQLDMYSVTSWDGGGAADWAGVLAGFPLFSGLGRRRLNKLARRATVDEYAPGDYVVHAGMPGDALHVILGGTARVLGKRAPRALHTGDYFGELSLLNGTPVSATVVAVTDLHVLNLPREAFLELTEHDPHASLEMLTALGSQLLRLEAQVAGG